MEMVSTRSATVVVATQRGTLGERIVRKQGRFLLYLIAIVVASFFVAPYLWTVGSSLKTSLEVREFPPALFPVVPRFQNYLDIWQVVPLGAFFLNSVQVTVLAMIGQLTSATLVAYGFSRFRFPGRDILFMMVISTILLPREVVLIPTFLIFKEFGWLDSLKPLIIPSYFGGGAFTIFLLRQFFLTLPRELDEAAKLDGANSFQILTGILLPLARPALATVAIFAFQGHWNDFLEPLIYISKPESFTLAIGLRYFQTLPNEAQEPREQLLMAAALVTTAPILLIFFAAQKYFVQGIVMSGIKG
jgi:multiple sugar transport system permease protein